MPTLKGLFVNAQKGGAALFVTGPHARCIETPEAQRPHTEQAAQFVMDAILGKYKHNRVGRFSPSAIAQCPRKSLFGYVGVPQAGGSFDNYDLMAIGTWGHMRWQEEGLSWGWMADAEVWTYDAEYNMGGSIDGLLDDCSLFELKTVTMGKYTRIVSVENEPLYDHRLQLQAYFHMEGVDLGSIVYEERNTGQFHEFRVEADDLLEADLLRRLEMLNNWVADAKLPPMLEDCKRGVGDTFRACPFRDYCPNATKLIVPQEEAA